ncbi:MAG TPA: NADH-quinone oxidoreductase subunit C, partial [Flavisolibacter sp.]|nr:NADH-quinone oxidoreductase subunit C [Flavisolibacter sp.]
MPDDENILHQLQQRFGTDSFSQQNTVDEIPTFWVGSDHLIPTIDFLKHTQNPFHFLYDLCGIDERDRRNKQSFPVKDFTLVYTLFSYARNSFIRLKLALEGDLPSVSSITSLFKNANWYEREIYDMFGIRFEGHPHLQRLLMPLSWKGYPLRKEHPARATELGPFKMYDELDDREQAALEFKPEEWGMQRDSEDGDF